MQGSQLTADDDLIPQGKRGENAGHRKGRENPARQHSAKTVSVLVLTVSPCKGAGDDYRGYKDSVCSLGNTGLAPTRFLLSKSTLRRV